MKTIVTHSGTFHTDDIFAVATLLLVYGKKNCNVIRTRDESIIASADIVVDVGGVYDTASQRFDHHQKEFEGEHRLGIPFASFGLVWQEYGTQLCGGSEDVADIVEKTFVYGVDADDNGVIAFTPTSPYLTPFTISDMCKSFNQTWEEEHYNQDEAFMYVVDIAMSVLKRVIAYRSSSLRAREYVRPLFENRKHPQIVELDCACPYKMIIDDYPEVLYVIEYRNHDSNHLVYAAPISKTKPFTQRKPFPASWRGLRNEELQKITGVQDAIFCHKSGFLCVVDTNEGAWALAELALKA